MVHFIYLPLYCEVKMGLLKKLTSEGPKRILALDGGGIRGAVTLGYLEKIEQILRERHGKNDLKLCEYFDLIGGTSTGAIIAGALAIGKSASEIKELYLNLGGKVFGKKKWKKWEALFDEKMLEIELEHVFKEIILGGEEIITGLCIVTKRADTRSTWPLINHPNGKYYELNRGILLRDAIRASAAAPVYFVPTKFDVGEGKIGAFIDGGVSMANNPSFQLFLLATLKGFPFRWKTGENDILLVSVGTGCWEQKENPDDVINDKIWDWAKQVPSMLMEDANWHHQLILQYLSRTSTPWVIDTEINDLSEDLLTPEPALTYLRYDVRLETNVLEELGLAELKKKLTSLRDMSAGENRFDLAEIGKKAAERAIKEDHFPFPFNLY